MAAVAHHVATNPPSHILTHDASNPRSTSNASVLAMHNDGSSVDTVGNSPSQSGDTASGASSLKKAKNKKATDPLETSKLLAAKISQLESDKAGEKDQEAEIGTILFLEIPRAPLVPSSEEVATLY